MEKDSEKKSDDKIKAKKAPAAAAAAPDVNAAAPKAALAQGESDPLKTESVKGPPGAPIGYGVHKLSIEGGNPYAAKQMYRSEEPVPNLQHQPVILQPGVAPEAPVAPVLSPEMQYRTTMGETGLRADEAGYNKIVAAGMTDTPKSRWGFNSVLNPPTEEAADKAKNASVKADPNAAPVANATKDAKPEVAPAADAAKAPEAAKAPAADAKAPEAKAAAVPPVAAALMQK